MEKSKYSEFDSYTILCDNSKGFKLGYESFLKFREVKKFINQIANKGGDTFTYENDIYNKKITSSQAQNMLNSIFNNRCDYRTFKLVANQLGVQI
tara:strand:+ start:248 stop:532 length:285 start_codon:yes stop_codon:yes gene_type:complete